MKFIALEAYCMEEIEAIDSDMKEAFCENEEERKGIIGARCFNMESHSYCKNLMFGTAKESIIVTGPDGFAVNGTCFWPDTEAILSEEEWEQEVSKWINKEQEYVEEIRKKNRL